MAFSDLADLALSAVQATFGENVSYTPRGGSPQTISGVFNAQSFTVDGATGLRVMTTQPTLLIKLNALAAHPKQGDAVTVRTVAYTVKEWDDDGEGGSLLWLQKA